MTDILQRIHEMTSRVKEGKGKKVAAPDPLMHKKIKEHIEKRPQAPSLLQEKAEEAKALMIDIAPKVAAIPVITSPEQYATMDKFLGVIGEARKTWKEKVEEILKPMRAAKKAVHDLDNSIDGPREKLELVIKARMADWQRKLLAERDEEERIKREEQEKIEAQAREVEQKAQAARSPHMQTRLLAQLAELKDLAQAVQQVEPETKLQRGSSSHTKTPMKWKLVNMKLLVQAVALGDIPLEVLTTNDPAINKYFKNDQDEVRDWPGIEVYKDVVIAKGQQWQGEE